MQKSIVVQVGQQYGRLTFVELLPTRHKNKLMMGMFRCTCGVEVDRALSYVHRGKVTSCGCYRRETSSLRARNAKGVTGFNLALAQYKKAAARRAYSWRITDDEFRTLIHSPCHYCAAAPSRVIRRDGRAHSELVCNGIDRVDNHRGYEDPGSQTVACCMVCNRAKGSMTMQEWLTFLQRAFSPTHYQRVQRWYQQLASVAA